MLFLQVSYPQKKIFVCSYFSNIWLSKEDTYLVVCVFKILWLYKASGDGEEFYPSFVLLAVFKILGCPSFVLLFFFLKILSTTSDDGANSIQGLFFF